MSTKKPNTIASKVAGVAVGLAAVVGSYLYITVPANNTLITVRTQGELYEAFRAAETNNITEIRIAAPILYIDSGIRITGKIFSPSKKLKVYGNTCIKFKNDTIKAGLYRIPKDQNEALNVFQSQSITFEGITIIGKGKGTGIIYSSGYGGGLFNCSFEDLGTGSDFQFVLMGTVKNCLFTNCREYGLRFRNGQHPGAGLANAQSNHCRAEQDRVFNYEGAFAAFTAEGASGCVFDQCISEGKRPMYHFYINALGSSVVKDCSIFRCHIESEVLPGGAGIRAILMQGYINIDGVFSQYAMVLVDARGSVGYPHIYVSRVPYILTGTKFAMDGTDEIWIFEDVAGFNVKDATRWLNGVVPYYYSCMNYTQAPDWTYGDLKMNGKKPVLQ
jgi:hypothetical protein